MARQNLIKRGVYLARNGISATRISQRELDTFKEALGGTPTIDLLGLAKESNAAGTLGVVLCNGITTNCSITVFTVVDLGMAQPGRAEEGRRHGIGIFFLTDIFWGSRSPFIGSAIVNAFRSKEHYIDTELVYVAHIRFQPDLRNLVGEVNGFYRALKEVRNTLRSNGHASLMERLINLDRAEKAMQGIRLQDEGYRDLEKIGIYGLKVAVLHANLEIDRVRTEVLGSVGAIGNIKDAIAIVDDREICG